MSEPEVKPRYMIATPMEVDLLFQTIDTMFDLCSAASNAMCDSPHTMTLDVSGILLVGRRMAIEAANFRAIGLGIEKAGIHASKTTDDPPF